MQTSRLLIIVGEFKGFLIPFRHFLDLIRVNEQTSQVLNFHDGALLRKVSIIDHLGQRNHQGHKHKPFDHL